MSGFNQEVPIIAIIAAAIPSQMRFYLVEPDMVCEKTEREECVCVCVCVYVFPSSNGLPNLNLLYSLGFGQQPDKFPVKF
jgi:hypothetical protein